MAVFTGQMMYGASGMNPDRKYEMNMMLASKKDSVVILPPSAFSSAEDSERYPPADIENASTRMRTTPVSKIVSLPTPADATPARSPTVETRLSSTPKTKLRK